MHATGLSKARLSQIAGDTEPFGEAAARKLAQDLGMPEDWFNHTWPTPKEAARSPSDISKNAPRQEQDSWVNTTKDPKPSNSLVMESLQTLEDHGGTPAAYSPGSVYKRNAVLDNTDVVINQYDVSAGMGNSRVLLNDQPGIIKSWNVERTWLDANVPSYTSINNLAIVTGFGPSMRPLYNPGDPLLVDTGIRSIPHDGVYFFRVGDEGFIKIIQRVPSFDGSGIIFRVISKNPDYPPYDINPNNQHFEVLAKVLTIWKSESY